MKQGFVKAASATPAIRVADPVYNAQVICEQMEEAVSHGAKIVVFPELCITGYTCAGWLRSTASSVSTWNSTLRMRMLLRSIQLGRRKSVKSKKRSLL